MANTLPPSLPPSPSLHIQLNFDEPAKTTGKTGRESPIEGSPIEKESPRGKFPPSSSASKAIQSNYISSVPEDIKKFITGKNPESVIKWIIRDNPKGAQLKSALAFAKNCLEGRPAIAQILQIKIDFPAFPNNVLQAINGKKPEEVINWIGQDNPDREQLEAARTLANSFEKGRPAIAQLLQIKMQFPSFPDSVLHAINGKKPEEVIAWIGRENPDREHLEAALTLANSFEKGRPAIAQLLQIKMQFPSFPDSVLHAINGKNPAEVIAWIGRDNPDREHLEAALTLANSFQEDRPAIAQILQTRIQFPSFPDKVLHAIQGKQPKMLEAWINNEKPGVELRQAALDVATSYPPPGRPNIVKLLKGSLQ